MAPPQSDPGCTPQAITPRVERYDGLHAAAHAVIENQIAMDVEGRREGLAALLARGMDRHEAVHELAKDAMGQIYNVLKGSD